MSTTHLIGSPTLFAGATVGEHGVLIPDRKLPLNPGEHVSLTISTAATNSTAPTIDLRGTVLSYKNPFESAIPVDDWEAGSER
jgi:hypothetical protein